MSLFDVIRYPITDIYNANELSALPEDLYCEWLESCSGKVLAPHANRGIQLHTIIIERIVECTRIGAEHREGGWEALWKQAYLKQLKRMIEEYDED